MTTAPALLAGKFKVEPYTSHCAVIYGEADHAVIGVSPGNSYFSATRLHDLALWGLARFDRVDFVYTDLFVAEMHEADGYAPVQARQKAVKNLRGVRAKVSSACAQADPKGDRLSWHPMSAFQGNTAYREIHGHLQRQLTADSDFRGVCEALVTTFLASKASEAASEQQRSVCLDYVLAEAPLFLDTPAILGVPSSLNCYHQLLPLAELLYSRGAGLRASRNQGHAVVTPIEDEGGHRDHRDAA